MKIVLVNPPNTHELIGNDPIVIKEEQGCYPPLGLLSIAGYLISRGYDDVHVIDAQASKLSHSEVAEKVAELKPDVVGLTVMTFTLIDCSLVIEEIRKRVNTRIVIGGPHCSIFHDLCIGSARADSIIIGEGELAFEALLRDYPEVKPQYKLGYTEDLDALPYPARLLVDINLYHSILSESKPITTAFSSRGCPYGCTFCDRPALGKRFRYCSAKRVVDEMEWCEGQGIKEIFFYDDTFTVSRKRVEEICERYKKAHLRIKWDIRARVNTVDEQILHSLHECNVSRIHFGIESASPRVIREINKGITPLQVERAFDSCKRFGIKTLAYFMIGNPTETMEDLKEDLRMIKRIKPDYLHMTILTMFPATKIYDEAQNLGLVKGDPWADYAKNPTPDFVPPSWDAIYSRKEHNAHLKWLFKKFYLRPSYLAKSIADIRSWCQFRRYAKAGLSILRF